MKYIEREYPNVNRDHTPTLPPETDGSPLPGESVYNDTAEPPISWEQIMSALSS